jgi:hypothetical protein
LQHLSHANAWGWNNGYGGWYNGWGYHNFGYGGGYGHYGLWWHQSGCCGQGSGNIYQIGYNQGFYDSSNSLQYDCSGHSYTYCSGYSSGFSAGQNQPINNNEQTQGQTQQSDSYSNAQSIPNIHITVNNIIPNSANATSGAAQNSGSMGDQN